MDEEKEENNLLDLNSLGQLTPEMSEYIRPANVKEYLTPEPFMDDLLHSTPETIDANVHYEVEQLSKEEVKKKIVNELLSRKKRMQQLNNINPEIEENDEHFDFKS